MRAEEVADFTAFVRARSGSLFRTAILLTGERGAAEVVRADAPEAYARRILVNLHHDGGRRARRRPAELALPEDAGDPAPDPYRKVLVRDELLRVLRTLPPSMRTVLVLRYFDDAADAEIAAALAVSESTVRSQAARGLARLRTAVDGHAVRPGQGGDR